MFVKKLPFIDKRIAWSFWLFVLALLIAGLTWPAPANADVAVVLQADGQFTLAERLFRQQKYLLARLEYERFIHFFPEDERVPQAQYRMGMTYYVQRQYDSAIQAIRPLMETASVSTDFQVAAFFMTAESHERLGRLSVAISILNNLEIQSNDISIQDEAIYRRGWIYLNSGDWERAGRAFNKISPQGRERFRVTELIRQLEETDQIERLIPGLAGALAIIPGGGYLYCRRYKDALISFLVNGGLIYAAYEAFDNDLVALGGLITFMEIGFYAGNIYGSISSAHKYNRNRQRDFIDHLKQNLRINLSAQPQNEGLELAFQYCF
jgi:tetratricopeptide (TPR) repeat protein